VTLATASFPCNDLSLAGARRGLMDGAQSSAFWGFTRILSELGARRPPLILLENVVGFLSSHGGADLTQALAALNALGYLVDVFILDAAHFVPQSRQRLFIVGTQVGLAPDEATVDGDRGTPGGAARADGSADTHGAAREADVASALGARRAADARPRALRDYIAAHPEVRWRIRRLPPQPTSDRRLDDILEDFPDDAREWWSDARTQRLLDQMNARHRALADELIQADEWRYGTIFRRTRNGAPMAELRVDGVAGCLRTPRGGSARQIVFKGGGGRAQARLLTGREAARLMGADDYTLDVSLNDALFGFGDAVCVPVINWIATYYLNPLVNELLRGRLLGLPGMEA
jgi:DNA (cytosine-5)-methyltransferase 1